MAAARLLFTSVLFVSVICAMSGNVRADDGQPIAIRNWPGGGTTIETQWGITLGLRVDESTEKQLESMLDFKLESLQADESVVLSRAPNSVKVNSSRAASDLSQVTKLTANQVLATRGKRGEPTTVFVDGVVLLLFSESPGEQHFKTRDAADKVSETMSQRPLAVVIVGDEIDAAACQKIAASYKPGLMVVPGSMTKVGEAEVEAVSHNTVAFSTSKRKGGKTKFVSLGDKAYEMNSELKELFAKKEKACKASQEFFAELSVQQMNFKPSNGTHTPRWNPEHMMGRELLFFSQIYNAVDPMIPVMNLNPKQMPKDYQFAHPDWTGAEEARQMQRVTAFTRRFAYLLDKMDLDEKAKGSRFWTPRALLQQMHRHYSEHTANVKKKMELPGWPEK